MRKIVLVLAMVAMVGAVSAQELSLGVKGGLNISNLSGKGVDDAKMKLGFHVGLGADYEFAPNMAVQSGLLFTTKGAKAKELGVEGTLDMMYLQLPVHFAYKMDINPGTRFVLHAGPYVAYGVGGKTKFEEKGVSLSFDTFGKRKIGGVEVEGAKRFDAGLGIGAGFEFGQFLVDLGWDMGLVNVGRDKDNKITTQNGYLSLGYKF